MVKSGPFGSSGGHSFTALPDSAATVSTIEAWSDRKDGSELVSGIRLTWTNGVTSDIFGHEKDNGSRYTFDGNETITKFNVRSGSYIDGFYFETSKGGSFAIGGNGGDEHDVAVGDGSLEGFEGFCGWIIDGFTVYFR